MKKFTALHLADVRLRRGDEQAHAPVLHALFQDMAALRDAGTQIDAIFFTGELVAPDACAGTTPAYVYEYLLRPLLQAASLPGARFYLVPGSRAQGGTAVAAGHAGFSFFSAGEHATAEQRGLYKNIHAVFHGNSHTGDSSSLMKSLGILFKSSPASLYGGPEQRAAYALLEYDAEAAGAQWTVALREFDEAGKAFALSVLYTPNGQESAERDAEYVFSTLLPTGHVRFVGVRRGNGACIAGTRRAGRCRATSGCCMTRRRMRLPPPLLWARVGILAGNLRPFG